MKIILDSSFRQVHEEGRPFDDPPLPRYARGVPRAGSSQVGTLKPRSCVLPKGAIYGQEIQW